MTDDGRRRTPRLNALEGDPREMRSAVVYEFHGVNPVQLGREEREERKEEKRPSPFLMVT